MALAVFFSQTLSLLLELAIFRFLSIEHFHQFASVTVGVVLAGYGFSGFLLYLLGKRNSRFYDPGPYLSAFPVAITMAVLALYLAAVEPSHLLVSPGKALILFLLFLLLSSPFALSGAIVGSALATLPMSAFRVYGLSMAGAGTGALLWFPLARTISLKVILAGIVLGSALLFFAVSEKDRSSSLTRFTTITFSLIGVLYILTSPQPLSQYKALSQFRKIEDGRFLGKSFDIEGEYVTGSTKSLHALPGLSPRYRGNVPEQIFAFHDGNNAGWSLLPSPSAHRDLLGYMPETAPFLHPGAEALLIGFDGGILQAMGSMNGYERITVVEGRAGLLSLMSRSGQPVDPRATIVVDSPIHYVKETDATFDLIFLPEAGSLSYSMMQGKPLSENYLLTVEMIGEAAGLLREGGVIAFSGWSKNPLREEGKILNLLRNILAADEPEKFAEKVVIVYGYSRFVIMATPGSFDGLFFKKLTYFLEKTGFPALVNGLPRSGDYEDRRYVEAILPFLNIGVDDNETSPFSLSPPDNDRPYFYRFFRLGEAGQIFAEMGRASLVFFESGYLMLLLSLGVVGIWGTCTVLMPSLLILRAFIPKGSTGFRLLALGVLCGFGYTVTEMILVGRASFFFRSYTEGFLVIISIFLTASGLGAIVGEKYVKDGRRVYLLISSAVIVLLFAAAMLPFYRDVWLPLSTATEMVVFSCLSGIVSFLLGFYLPPVLAMMRADVGVEGLVALWGINNFSSLLGSLATPLITVNWGFPVAVLGASFLYLLFAVIYNMKSVS